MIEAAGLRNLPLTDRRSFLRRAVTALAAGAAVNVTAIVATRPAPAADLPQEDPAIIALGERIEPLLAAYRNAAEDRLKARANAEANCPAVRLIETAEKYEAEREAAIEQSGLPDAKASQWEEAYETEKLGYEACDIELQTMAGVLVQARALTACAEVEIEVGHHRGRAGQLVGIALAQSLTRLSAHETTRRFHAGGFFLPNRLFAALLQLLFFQGD